MCPRTPVHEFVGKMSTVTFQSRIIIRSTPSSTSFTNLSKYWPVGSASWHAVARCSNFFIAISGRRRRDRRPLPVCRRRWNDELQLGPNSGRTARPSVRGRSLRSLQVAAAHLMPSPSLNLRPSHTADCTSGYPVVIACSSLAHGRAKQRTGQPINWPSLTSPLHPYQPLARSPLCVSACAGGRARTCANRKSAAMTCCGCGQRMLLIEGKGTSMAYIYAAHHSKYRPRIRRIQVTHPLVCLADTWPIYTDYETDDATQYRLASSSAVITVWLNYIYEYFLNADFCQFVNKKSQAIL